jgi:hypothetical protein
MQPETHADRFETQPISARTRRRRNRHRLLTDLDKRSRGGRRAVELMRQFERELGGDITAGQRLAIGRAATLCALAEDARIRRLNGAVNITLDDLVRLDRVAALAVRALGITAGPVKPREPSLDGYLNSNAEEA